MKNPNVLIINSQSMFKENATGITLRSLWEEWPKENIFEIYANPMGTKNDVTNALLPHKSIYKRIVKSSVSKSVNEKMKGKTTDFSPQKQSWSSKVRQLLVALCDCYPLNITKKEMLLIKQFKPDVIYTLGASVAVLRLAYRLSMQFNIPIIIHYMDNWIEHIQWANNPLLHFYTKKIRQWNAKCITRSCNAIVISPSMKLAYEKKLKIKCYTLMNSFEPSISINHSSEHDILHFIYAGGLHLERWKSLREIAMVIKNLNIKAIMDVYTNNHEYKSQFEGLPVVFHEYVAHDKIQEVYMKSDLLIHVERYNKELTPFFKYSISTKIPEYLSVGKPLLFYGPKQIGLYSYLAENHAAYLAYDKESLISTIKTFIKKENLELVLKNAYQLFLKNHTVENAHTILLEIVQSAERGF